MTTDAFEARALQHELDHCAGLLFLDRVAGAHAIHARSTYLECCTGSPVRPRIPTGRGNRLKSDQVWVRIPAGAREPPRPPRPPPRRGGDVHPGVLGRAVRRLDPGVVGQAQPAAGRAGLRPRAGPGARRRVRRGGRRGLARPAGLAGRGRRRLAGRAGPGGPARRGARRRGPHDLGPGRRGRRQPAAGRDGPRRGVLPAPAADPVRADVRRDGRRRAGRRDAAGGGPPSRRRVDRPAQPGARPPPVHARAGPRPARRGRLGGGRLRGADPRDHERRRRHHHPSRTPWCEPCGDDLPSPSLVGGSCTDAS